MRRRKVDPSCKKESFQSCVYVDKKKKKVGCLVGLLKKQKKEGRKISSKPKME